MRLEYWVRGISNKRTVAGLKRKRGKILPHGVCNGHLDMRSRDAKHTSKHHSTGYDGWFGSEDTEREKEKGEREGLKHLVLPPAGGGGLPVKRRA
jgi:hypothetical protein